MLTRIMAAGLLAGVLSGICVSVLQHATTVPLILKAEAYEKAGAKPAVHQHSTLESLGEAQLILAHAATPDADVAASDHPASAWAPADGIERTAYTTLATVGTAVGFALILLAAMIATGVDVTVRQAALWGLGAFVATGLAPAVGLPPELPGSAATELLARQTWWIATAATTGAGIWLIFRNSTTTAIAAGVALIALPHAFGAPHIELFTSSVPAEIAGHFTAASLAIHAVMWVLVGALSGYFWQRLGRSEALA